MFVYLAVGNKKHNILFKYMLFSFRRTLTRLVRMLLGRPYQQRLSSPMAQLNRRTFLVGPSVAASLVSVSSQHIAGERFCALVRLGQTKMMNDRLTAQSCHSAAAPAAATEADN